MIDLQLHAPDCGNKETLLTPEEVKRYNRHILLPDIGAHGQQKLKKARVLIIGMGGLGSPLALYLSAAGIGTIGLADFDAVDESNLQRQVIHNTRNVGMLKVDSGMERIKDLNPFVNVITHNTQLSGQNALDIIKDYDIVADGTDNIQTRYIINDTCVISGKPYVYGTIFQYKGQTSVFAVKDGPCYRCLYPSPPLPELVPDPGEAGVLGVLPGIIGTIQAAETIKIITGIAEPLVARLLLFDVLSMRFRELQLKKDPSCKVCGRNPPSL